MSKGYLKCVLQWFTTVGDMLYPPRCPICTGILKKKEKTVCPGCQKQLPYIRKLRCMKCGKQLSQEEQEYCLDCLKKEHFFKQGIALWSYHKQVKNSVYRFKYKNKREYATAYANEILRIYKKIICCWGFNAIIPIPLYYKKKKKRGYNQAEVLAKELGKMLNLPVYSDILIRTRDTKPQKQLNDKERQKNLKKAFKFCPNSIELNKVAIIDDIYTTGTTADEAARCLLDAGIQEVYLILLCIGKGY